MTATIVEFVCKCIACSKRFTMTDAQINEAQAVGCAISPCCGFPSTVVRVNTESDEGVRRKGRTT